MEFVNHKGAPIALDQHAGEWTQAVDVSHCWSGNVRINQHIGC